MTAYTEIQAYPLGWKIGVGIFVVLSLFIIPRFDTRIRHLLICLLIFIDVFAIYFVSRKLVTTINEKGICYEMFPNFLGQQQLTWDEISTVSVDKMSRFRTRQQNIAHNIGNRYALFIRLEDGKRIMLGTKRPYEINVALIKFSRIRYQSYEYNTPSISLVSRTIINHKSKIINITVPAEQNAAPPCSLHYP